MVRGPFGGRGGLKKWPGGPLCYCVFQPKSKMSYSIPKMLIWCQNLKIFFLINTPLIVALQNTLMVLINYLFRDYHQISSFWDNLFYPFSGLIYMQKRIKGRVQKIKKKLKNYFCSFKFYGVRNNEKWSREKQNKGTISP